MELFSAINMAELRKICPIEGGKAVICYHPSEDKIIITTGFSPEECIVAGFFENPSKLYICPNLGFKIKVFTGEIVISIMLSRLLLKYPLDKALLEYQKYQKRSN